jgi:Tol biopolymer transport system component
MVRFAVFPLVALLTLLLGSVACGSEASPPPTTTPTVGLSEAEEIRDEPAVIPQSPAVTVMPASATPVLPTATRSVPTATASPVPPSSPVPPTEPPPTATATATPLPPLSGSGGGVIAFQSDRDRQDEIYVMNADGSDQRLLISNLRALDSMPDWSPDGGKIALASRDRGRDFEICVVSVTDDLTAIDGKTALRLTDNDFDDLHPTWSPDGSQIAFFSERDGYSEIYVIDVDGAGERQLTDNDVNDKDPAWSPDGTQIAFISRRDGDYDIYVMQADGGDQRPLTDNDTNEWSPAWSPDGTQIVFASDLDNERHLYVMGADGSSPRRLTDASFPWNDDPAWSPDGTQIAFRSNRGGFVDVYLMNADGSSNPQQLTDNAEIDQDRAPSWRPGGADPAR